MSKRASDYGGSISASAAPPEAEDETGTIASSAADDGNAAAATATDGPPSAASSHDAETNRQGVEDVSTNDSSGAASCYPASRSLISAAATDEAEARRRSFLTAPGAFHVRTVPQISPTELRRSSNDPEDDEELEVGSTRPNNNATADVLDAQVEAVAAPIHEAAYQAVPVVDALTTSRILEDGEEQSYQLESGTSQQSASLEDGHTSHTSHTTGVSGNNTKNKYVIWGLAALLLVAVVLGVGLGLGLSRPEDTGSPSSESQTNGGGGLQGGTAATGNPGGTNQDTSYRLVEIEISPQIESSMEHVSSSLSLGLMLPTDVPGTLSRSLIVGWDRNGGTVKVYRSQKGNESLSFGPFIESVTISLSDGSDGNMSDSSGGTGSAFIVDGGADGESFAISYRSRIQIYSSYLHEAKRLCCQAIIEREGFTPGSSLDPATIAALAKTLAASDPESNETLPASDLWYQRGITLVGDDDPAIRDFGSSMGYSPSGPHFLMRLVVGSDSGHVRAYRSKWLNGTILQWQRLDGGLLDPGPDSNPGKAVVAMAGSGLRFAVGYPSLGKVSLYRFIDGENIDETSSRPNIKLVDEIYSESGGNDMFGQSLSLDIFANFLVVGAKGYVRAYWLQASSSSLAGFELAPAGDKIFGEESDGEEFGSVVASGRVPHHSGCVACPFVLDKQRIAISSPAYDNGRGRVLLYQYNEDEKSWRPLVSPIESEAAGEGMAHAVRISPGMGSVATSSSFGEVRAFEILPLM